MVVLDSHRNPDWTKDLRWRPSIVDVALTLAQAYDRVQGALQRLVHAERRAHLRQSSSGWLGEGSFDQRVISGLGKGHRWWQHGLPAFLLV